MDLWWAYSGKNGNISMVSSPKAPDPVETASTQSAANRDTATSQQLLNMVNQVTPDGSLTYTQTGERTYVDSLTGKTVSVPEYTATTAYSPEQSAIKTETDAATLNLSKLANQQSSALSEQLSKPFSYSTSDAENYAYDLGTKRLDPQFATDQDKLRTQLISSGIRPGSAAYDQQMQQFGQTKNDAYNQLALSSQQQGYNQALTEYNNSVNTTSALTSGNQVSSPTFQSTPTTSVAGTDYTGLVNQQYQQQSQNQSSTLGGLFGLATAGVKAFSDRRLKKDIIETGRMIAGLPVYLFRYIWDAPISPLNTGFMSEDVRKVRPEAVTVDPSGFDQVNYSMILEGV